MKVTIIGAGNMGGAIAEGLVRAGRRPEDITVTAAHRTSLERFAGKGLSCTTDNRKAVRDAGIVFIAVKPWIAPAVISELKEVVTAGQTIVSVCPGVKPEQFTDVLGEKCKLIYFIPNTAIAVCESMSFILPVNAADEDVRALETLMEGTGKNMTVPFKQLPAVTALASCGIAYALRYIRAACEGGVEMGIYPSDARSIVAQTVRGAAALLEANGTNPEEEIDRVTTPGGLTIKGLNAMEEAGFTNAVIKGLKAGR